MKNNDNLNSVNIIFLFILLISILVYLIVPTGIHGDDYAMINEYLGKDLNFYFSLDPRIRNQNLFGIFNHFLFYWAYPILKFNFIIIYDFLKIIIHLISLYFILKFISLYLSINRSILFSIAFVFYPLHDSTIFWYMTSPYVFTPSIIFYSAYLIKKNYNSFICSIFLIIGCFSSYSSPPFMFGICILFLLEKNYRSFLLVFIILLMYFVFYFTFSFYFPDYEKRLPENFDLFVIIKNYFLQILTAIDTFIGPSFFLKIYSSITSINFISLVISTLIFIITFQNLKLEKFIFNKNLFISFLLISLSSLFVFSITNQYWQSPFNLNNRITVSSTLLFIYFILTIKKDKVLIILFFVLVIYPLFGLSDHWKKWNYNQETIIENINNNQLFEKIKTDDLLIIKDNMYSQLGNFSHIELFVMPWIRDSIFKNYNQLNNMFSLNQYSEFSDNILIDNKFDIKFNLNNYDIIYLYSTMDNQINIISKNDVPEILKKIDKKNRHWIQFLNNKYLNNFVISVSPRLKYLF